jgi:hypothetical protein
LRRLAFGFQSRPLEFGAMNRQDGLLRLELAGTLRKER